MTLFRPILVALAAAALLLGPGAVSASADTERVAAVTKGPNKAEIFPTQIAFFPADRVRAYGSVTVVWGQVVRAAGSIAGTVSLERRFKGSTTWVNLGTAETTQNDTAPRFRFEVATKANAFYRVSFADRPDVYAPSSAITEVSAYRAITTHIKSRTLLMSGKVAPNYTGKPMYVERKTCKSCQYKRMRSIVVGPNSTYKTTLAAPARGRWFFRLTIPGSPKFIASTTGTIATYRV